MAIREKSDIGLRAAIKAAGSSRRLAERLGITPQAVSLWDQVPTDRVPSVEKVTGVPRHVLRPDMWAAPAFAQPEAVQ